MQKYPIYGDILDINRKYLHDKIKAGLLDKNPDMRINMVKVIRDSDDPAKEETLRRVMAGEKDERVRGFIRGTLGYMPKECSARNYSHAGVFGDDDCEILPSRRVTGRPQRAWNHRGTYPADRG
jgi:hypothetical protein